MILLTNIFLDGLKSPTRCWLPFLQSWFSENMAAFFTPKRGLHSSLKHHPSGHKMCRSGARSLPSLQNRRQQWCWYANNCRRGVWMGRPSQHSRTLIGRRFLTSMHFAGIYDVCWGLKIGIGECSCKGVFRLFRKNPQNTLRFQVLGCPRNLGSMVSKWVIIYL